MQVNYLHALVSLCLVTDPAATFFTYEDCDHCRTLKTSCEIDELSPTHFEVTCIDNDGLCMSDATPSTVCITPDGHVKGGSLLWPDYDAWKHHTTSTTTSSPTRGPITTPSPSAGGSAGWIASTVCLLIAVTILLGISSRLFLLSRRNGYERIEPTQALPTMDEVEI